MISFIVPAHDEEALLARTLTAIHGSAATLDRPYEIVVADDASTDRTPEIAAMNGARVIRVEHRQISATRNAGARASDGEYLLFVDADTVVTPAAVRAAVAAMDGGVSGGGSIVRFDGRLPLYARVMQRVASAGQRVGRFAAGCFVFCTRAAFDATGGFDESMFGAEEMEFSKALKRHGRFVVLRTPVVSSGRKLRAYSGWTIAKTMTRLALLGRRGVRARENMPLWYEPRRADPDPPE